MKRPKHLLARYDHGTQVVILEIEADTAPDEEPRVRYELANRAELQRISDTEFIIVQTGAVLTLQRKSNHVSAGEMRSHAQVAVGSRGE